MWGGGVFDFICGRAKVAQSHIVTESDRSDIRNELQRRLGSPRCRRFHVSAAGVSNGGFGGAMMNVLSVGLGDQP